ILTVFPLFIFSVYFGNAVLLGAIFPFIFFIINLKHIKDVKSYKAFLALFLGYEKDAADVGEFEALLGREGHFELRASKEALGEKVEGEGKVWVTPAIPFVILITIGFVISVIYGDILSLLMLKLV
ncbi:MAG: A24 family peptidase C-terminal domain-containing protein, partial [Candidatus Hydrothermarchaeales archaeon]